MIEVSLISGRAMRRLALVTSTALIATATGAFLYGWSEGTPPANAAQAVPPDAGLAVPMQELPDTHSAYLMLEGIEGDSEAPGQEGALELLSWSFGASQASHGAGGGGGAGKVQMQDFHFTASVSKATPMLFQRCASGQHIKNATLTLRKAGGGQQEYMVMRFNDLLISSYQLGGSSVDVIPTDQVSINFSKVKIDYFPRSRDGVEQDPVSSVYDATTGQDG